MQVKITPYQPGDKGYACLPLASNLPPEEEVKKTHPDWKLVKCPSCGADCWESDLARQVKAQGVGGLCTLCALRKGTGGKENA